jgi:hypothetical protein
LQIGVDEVLVATRNAGQISVCDKSKTPLVKGSRYSYCDATLTIAGEGIACVLTGEVAFLELMDLSCSILASITLIYEYIVDL